MSALAKVLVVLNLVLVLFFAGAAGSLFATRKNWKEMADDRAKQYQDDVTAATDKISQLSAQNNTKSNNITELRGENQQLEQQKNDLQGEIASQRNDLKEKDSRIKTLEQNLTDRTAAYEEQVARNDRLEKDLRSARELQVAAQNDKQDAESRRARALLDAQQLAKTNSELNKELAGVREDLEEKSNHLIALRDAGVDIDKVFVTKPAPAISGVVAAVSPDVDLVVLGVGANDKVETGHEFTIYRGDTFIGKARVDKVLEDMAGARILFVEDGQEVRQGDRVSTRVGG